MNYPRDTKRDLTAFKEVPANRNNRRHFLSRRKTMSYRTQETKFYIIFVYKKTPRNLNLKTMNSIADASHKRKRELKQATTPTATHGSTKDLVNNSSARAF